MEATNINVTKVAEKLTRIDYEMSTAVEEMRSIIRDFLQNQPDKKVEFYSPHEDFIIEGARVHNGRYLVNIDDRELSLGRLNYEQTRALFNNLF